MPPEPSLSIVTTLYKSAPFIEEFLARAIAEAEKWFANFEIIVVDDGSPDDSLALTEKFASSDPRVKPAPLSRNFGHHNAIIAGLSRATGDYVFFVDSDLEECPENLGTFYQKMQKSDADVVYGYHRQNQGSWLRKFTSKNFWKIFSLLASVEVNENICHIRLMKRRYVNALLSLQERTLFMGGLYIWPGFSQEACLVDRVLKRRQSTYSFLARVKLFARSLVAFSARPLYAIFFIGLIITSVSFLSAFYFLINKIANPESVMPGFTMLIITITLIGGIVVLMQGITAIYLAKIYEEVKGRPRFIWKNSHEKLNNH